MTEAAGTFFGVQHFGRRVRERLAVLAQHQIAFGPAIPLRTIMSREVERQRPRARVAQIEREVSQERKQREFEEQARRRAVTEAEKIELRAKIFANLGLGPDGMCPTKPPVLSTALNQRMDTASLSIMSAQEIDCCERVGTRPADYIVARGVVNPRAVMAASAGDNADPMVNAAFESLAKYSADKNRDHLFAAQAAIARMLKRL